MPKFTVTYKSLHIRDFDVPNITYITSVLGESKHFEIIKIVDEQGKEVNDE